jgi:hypothetical protein
VNAEKLMVQRFPFIGLLDKHARTYCGSDQELLASMTLREYMNWCYYTSQQERAVPSTVCNHEDERTSNKKPFHFHQPSEVEDGRDLMHCDDRDPNREIEQKDCSYHVAREIAQGR